MITHRQVTCHRCGHSWAYTGSKVAAVELGEKKGMGTKCRYGVNTGVVEDKPIDYV